MGADFSTAPITAGSELNVANSEPIKPSDGVVAQIISQGRSPLMRKTAISMPQMRNHLLAFGLIVPRTSALMTALSTLLMTSNKTRPTMVRMISNNMDQEKNVGYLSVSVESFLKRV